ncbi:MAG: hypothetical protein K6T29_05010 [Peptococcaceae bacterium]|nr:hypothetical protein [Peptococcaceae bacterium]
MHKAETTGDQVIQQMLGDILAGLKAKLVRPVLEENLKIAARLEEMMVQDRATVARLMERLEALEEKVQQVPLAILASLRDAINQAGGGNQDAS